MTPTGDKTTNVTFDLPLIRRTGDIGEVLVDLMTNQTRKIQLAMRLEFKKDELPPKALQRIMGSFVSLEGTKQPRHLSELQFPDIPEKAVQWAVNKLVDARLLREAEDGVYELVHDTLAFHLNQNRDQEELAVDETVKMVKDAFYFQDKTNRYLLEAELLQVEKYDATIRSSNRLTEDEWEFVEKSRRRERRRSWTQLGVFGIVLLIAIVMSTLYTKNLQLIAANDLSIEQLEENRLRLEKSKELTGKTAEALKNSRSDRTDAFLSLRAISAANDEDETNQVLVNQLSRTFLSEFSLFPFYNVSKSLSEDIEEVIVDDELNFIIARAMDSPIAFFKDSVIANLQDSIPFRLFSSKFNEYGKIRDMLLMPDRKTLVTAHSNGNILKWEIGRDEVLDTIYHFKTLDNGHEPRIRQMTLAGNDLLVAVDSLIYRLNLSKTRWADFQIGFNRPVKFLIANPAVPGQYAVVKENSGKIFICQTGRDSIQNTYQAGLSTVTSLAYSPNGKKMIAAYEEGEIAKLWDLRRPQLITEFKGHQAAISSVTFSPDGRKILTGSWDQTAILWTNKGEIIKRLVGHTQRLRSVVYTKNNYAVTCSEDGNIKIWYLAPLAERELIFEDSVRALATTTAHDTIAFSLYDDPGYFYLWHWPSNQLKKVRQPLKRFDRPGDIVALAYTEDGKGIAVGSENSLTTLVDRSGNNHNEDYRGGGRGHIPPTPSISAVDVNQDYILISDRNTNKVLLRSRQDPTRCITLPHPNSVLDVCFSKDGHYVLSGCEDGNGYLWDISGDPVSPRLLKGHTSKVVAVDISSDSRYAVTGSYDNSVQLYRIQETKGGDISPEYKLEGIRDDYRGHTSDVNVVAFAGARADGSYRFFTGGADKAGKYWELRKDGVYELPSVIRHLDEINVGAFLPGDSLIVTGSFDETLKVWKAGQVDRLIDQRIFGR
ncbi:MAG: WD40 repeat domain-containing protein [Saprospiraceae bacterium]|nr:hypothetical protein [Lewinella sp.]